MKIYQILPNLYLGEELDISEDEKGIPIGYTRTSPPIIKFGEFAVWSGTYWRITNTDPCSELLLPINITQEVSGDTNND